MINTGTGPLDQALSRGEISPGARRRMLPWALVLQHLLPICGPHGETAVSTPLP